MSEILGCASGKLQVIRTVRPREDPQYCKGASEAYEDLDDGCYML